MIALLGYFVTHRTAHTILVLVILGAGLLVAPYIPSQVFPDVPTESIQVEFTWTGVGAADIDRAITARVEPGLRSLAGVRRTRSLSQDGYSGITLELDTGADLSLVASEVEAAIRAVADLPDDVVGPVVKRGVWRDGVVNIVLTGAAEIGQLARHVNRLQSLLLDRGVTQITIKGMPDGEIGVEVHSDVLERYGLTIAEIASTIRAETGVKAVGETGGDGTRIRAETRRLTAAAIGAVAVRSGTDGTRLTVADVASVVELEAERGEVLSHNGNPAVLIAVERATGGDILAIRRSVEAAVAELRATLPTGTIATIAQSRAEPIIGLMRLLVDNAAGGLAMVVVILLLFLSVRIAVCVGLDVLTATAATLVLMYFFGHTYNLISLFALVLCLGIVVDDGIVVAEYAESLARSGRSAADSATEAVRIMAGPVLASALTTIIAFGGLALIDGRFGRLLIDLPFTVVVILCASLFETYFILPAHLSRALSADSRRAGPGRLARAVNAALERFRERVFVPALRAALEWRYPAVAAGILLLAYAGAAVIDGSVPWRFFAAPENAVVRVNVAMLPGATRDDTAAMVGELERALAVVADRYQRRYGRAPVKLALATLGGEVGAGIAGAEGKSRDRLGGLEVELIAPEDRPYTVRRLVDDWQREVETTSQLETIAWRRQRGGPEAGSLEIRLTAADLAQLRRAAEALVATLARLPGARDVTSDLVYGRGEHTFTLTERGESLGFTTAAVAAELRSRLDGIDAVRAVTGTRETIVNVRAAGGPGDTAIEDALMRAPGGGLVRLDEIARLRRDVGVAAVHRDNGAQHVTVAGELVDEPAVAAGLLRTLRQVILPGLAAETGVDWSIGGLAEEEEAFLQRSAVVLASALVAIFFTLAWTFGSWSLPLVVVAVIPFGMVGTVFGHWVHDVPLNLLSIVGFIGLSGIIVNNAIVLGSAFERLPSGDRLAAIAVAAGGRLRAVLLTTTTTIAGIVPLLLETSREVQFLRPAIITLTYGLSVGTLVVLVLTPAMFAILADMRPARRSHAVVTGPTDGAATSV